MYVYYFSTSVSALSLLGMVYQILDVYMHVCMYKLKEVKTPWVLDGASSSYHSMTAYHTKS